MPALMRKFTTVSWRMTRGCFTGSGMDHGTSALAISHLAQARGNSGRLRQVSKGSGVASAGARSTVWVQVRRAEVLQPGQSG
jgi:hypothetical protein